MARKFQVTIPYAATEAAERINKLVGADVVRFPHQIEIREGDCPADAAEWPLRVDFWSPGLYVRAYCAGMDTDWGFGLSIIGVRIRTSAAYAADLFAAIGRKVAAQAAGGVSYPVHAALIRGARPEFGEKAELWVAGVAAGDFAPCWEAGLPQELSELLPAPRGMRIDDRPPAPAPDPLAGTEVRVRRGAPGRPVATE